MRGNAEEHGKKENPAANCERRVSGTAKKLGVNFFHYLRDRIGGARQMPSLADLIQQRAKDLKLGAS